MKKLLLASLLCISTFAANASVTIEVTASNQITNIPADFSAPNFILDRPWFIDQLPGFTISDTPTTAMLTVDPAFNMPGLSIMPNKGSTWFYYCDGLKFNYTQPNSAVSVVFTGQIDLTKPGSGVQCKCSGPACSTQSPVIAKLIIR